MYPQEIRSVNIYYVCLESLLVGNANPLLAFGALFAYLS